MAGSFGGPYTSMAGQTQIASQINGQSSSGGNSSNAAGNASFSHLAGMSKNQLYDVMSQMKVLIEQNQQQARQILVANPMLTKSLFQAQIMLGMVRPPQVMPNIQQSFSQPPQQQMHSGQQGQVQSRQQSQMNIVQNQPQSRQQMQMQVGQHGQMQMTTQSQPQSTPMQPPLQRTQQMTPHPPMQTAQPPQAPMPLQPASQPMQQPPQGWTLPMHPSIHSAPQNLPGQPQLPTVLSGQPQQSLNQSSSGLHQPMQPPLPQQPRPPLQPPLHQMQNQPVQSMGFQPSVVPHQPQPQATFQHTASTPQSSIGGPLQQHVQPPLPSHPPPQQLYHMNSGNSVGPVLHTGSDISGHGMGHGGLPTGGHGIQPGRGPNIRQGMTGMGPAVSWQPIPPESLANNASGAQPSTIQTGMGGPTGLTGGMIGGMGESVGPAIGNMGSGHNSAPPDVIGSTMIRTRGISDVQSQAVPQQQQQVTNLSPEQEKALLQQVMSLTPEQINCLPVEQRQQILQLQQILRG